MPIPAGNAAAANALATSDDLASMWRPLDESELDRANDLLSRASSLLRQAAPHIDGRISVWRSNPSDPTALNPQVVATVVATIVKRFISNVEGITTQSIGPFSVSYALRGDKDIRGELQVTLADLKAIAPYRPKTRIGSIRVRPALAPPPLGNLGMPLVASVAYDATGTGPFPVEVPVPIGWGDGYQ